MGPYPGMSRPPVAGSTKLGRHDGVRGARDRVVGRHAGEGDPDQLAYDAVPAVGTDQVARFDRVWPGRPADLEGHAIRVLGESGELVAAPDLDVEFDGPFLQHLLDPALRNLEDVEGVVVQHTQVDGQRAEDESGSGPRWVLVTSEPLVQASPV